MIAITLDNFLKIDGLTSGIGNFNADHGFAWNGRQNANAYGAQRHCQIIGQTYDTPNFDAICRFEFEHSNYGPRPDRDNLTFDTEIRELFLQDERIGL